MGLIAGSCVPLAQTLLVSVDPASNPSLNLTPDGETATLTLDEALTAVPLVLVRPFPGASGPLTYHFRIAREAGGPVLNETGETAPGAARDPAAPVELRFPETALAAERWTVSLRVRPPGTVDTARLRLVSSSPGLIPALITALTLAILGWLAASLGALHWIRTEAGRPVPEDGAPGGSAELERIWTVGCHLSALLGYVLPFGHLIGPMAIWFSKRRVYPGLERAGRDVLNFQLSATVYVLAGLFLSFFLIGVPVLFAVVVFHFTMVLYASLSAQRGTGFSYPLTMRFI